MYSGPRPIVCSRSRANLTAWALSSFPVLNLTPLRILKTYSLPSGEMVQDSASCGAACRLWSGRTVRVSYSSASTHQFRLPRDVWGSRLSTFCPQPTNRTLSGPAADPIAGQRARTVSSAMVQRRRSQNRHRLMGSSLLGGGRSAPRCSRPVKGGRARTRPARHGRVRGIGPSRPASPSPSFDRHRHRPRKNSSIASTTYSTSPRVRPGPVGQDQGLLGDLLADRALPGPEPEPLRRRARSGGWAACTRG